MELPRPGDVLADKYLIEEVLGEGGFGLVYRGTTQTTGRPVAIKVMKPPSEWQAATHGERFLREMKTVAQLQSPHTMTLYDFGRTDEDVHFMVCEYIEGEDLLEMLERRGRLWEHEVVHIIRQVLVALTEAHELGVLHRDIKPHNIRLQEYQGDKLFVKVLDFGLAKSWVGDEESLTAAGNVIGTPRYMSPEHRAGLGLTPASDIYSLGLVAVEMLIGRDATKLDRREHLRITESMPVTRPLALIVNRMISTLARERYTSAAEVLSDLGAMRTPTEHTPTMPALAADEADTLPEQPVGQRRDPTMLEEDERSDDVRSRSAAPWTQVLLVAGLTLSVVGFAMWFTSDSAPEERALDARTPQPAVSESVPPERREPAVAEAEAAASAADSGRADAELAAAAQSCSGYREFEPGVHSIDRMSGLSREGFVLAIPKNYDPTRRHGLVVMFHNLKQDPRAFAKLLDIENVDAAEYPYVAVALKTSAPLGWSTRETRRKLPALDDAAREVCVDLHRIFTLGHGSGGYGAQKAACMLNVQATATSAFRKGKLGELCQRPAPTLALTQTQDRVDPLSGGRNCAGIRATPYEQHLISFRTAHGCAGRERSVSIGHELSECRTWDCDAPLVSCLIDGGREWPGAEKYDGFESCWSEPADFPYRQKIWEFFKSHDPAFGDPAGSADASDAGEK